MSEQQWRSHPAAAIFPLLDEEAMGRLAADIGRNGLLHPVVLAEGLVLDGRNRLEACRRAGVEPRVVEFDGSDPVAYVIAANLERRHLSPSQQAALAVRLIPLLAVQARERQVSGLRQGARVPVPEKIPERGEAAGEARAVAARMVGVNPHYVSDAVRLAEKSPVAFQAVENGEMGLSAAMRELRREENRRLAQAVPDLTTHVSGQRYRTIVIDPPWDAGDEGDVDQMGRAQPAYATMPLAEIAALPVAEASVAEGCHLYLWITNRSLPKGFGLLEEWGFRYLTMLTWCKPGLGVGNYFRNNTEQVLFGIKGSLPLLHQDVGTWFEAKRQGSHSTKPEEFYALVRRLSPGPRLEMFARAAHEGFAAWGAEA